MCIYIYTYTSVLCVYIYIHIYICFHIYLNTACVYCVCGTKKDKDMTRKWLTPGGRAMGNPPCRVDSKVAFTCQCGPQT